MGGVKYRGDVGLARCRFQVCVIEGIRITIANMDASHLLYFWPCDTEILHLFSTRLNRSGQNLQETVVFMCKLKKTSPIFP